MRLLELVNQCGLAADTLSGRSYRCADPAAVLVPTDQIREGRAIDVDGHVYYNLVRILDAITKDEALPPIELDSNGKVADGFHRLVLSRALGAAFVPAIKVA